MMEPRNSLQSSPMASTIYSTPTTYLPPLLTSKKPTIFPISSSLLLQPQTTNSHLSSSIPQLGLGLLSPWTGLRRLAIPINKKLIKLERKERCKSKVVHASLFGVGAPEALVIGVVALLVFGPKGLAEVARNLGKTLRAFQPTIRELQDVSREFKSTLEREIGLDDIPPSMQNTRSPTTSSPPSDQNSQTTLDPNGTPLTNKLYSTEDYLKTTEDQLQAMAAQQQKIPQELSEDQSKVQEVAPAEKKPFNIGEVLVQAQISSSAAQKQEQTVPQEASQEVPQEAESKLEPQPKAPEASPSMPSPEMPESET